MLYYNEQVGESGGAKKNRRKWGRKYSLTFCLTYRGKCARIEEVGGERIKRKENMTKKEYQHYWAKRLDRIEQGEENHWD